MTAADELRGTIVEAWRDVLALDRLADDDDFYRLGGSSLSAAKICAQLWSRLGRDVTVGQLLRNPTVAAFATVVAGMSEGVADGLSPVRESAAGVYPLTAQQEAIWLLEQLAPGNTAYNSIAVVDPKDRLDIVCVQAALDALVRRHEALRTSFPLQDGIPVQVVGEPVPPVLDIIEVLSTDSPETEALVRDLGAHQFDPLRPPLIRWSLLRCPDDRDLLVQVEHHFVHDGWSMWILLNDFARYYREGPPSRVDLGRSYGDYALRQREWLGGPHAARQLRYWQSLLSDAPTATELGTDTAIGTGRPALFTFRGDTIVTSLQPDLARRTKRLASNHGVTPFAILMANFARTVSERTGRPDLTLGTTLRNRRQPGTAELVGMFVNTVALPVSCPPGHDVGQVATAVQTLLAAVLDHQELPFPRVVNSVRPRPVVDRNPLFQLCFSMNDWPDPRLDLGLHQPATMSFPSNGGAKFDLDVVVLPVGEEYTMLWRYYDGVLDARRVRDFARRFEELIGAADPA